MNEDSAHILFTAKSIVDTIGLIFTKEISRIIAQYARADNESICPQIQWAEGTLFITIKHDPPIIPSIYVSESYAGYTYSDCTPVTETKLSCTINDESDSYKIKVAFISHNCNEWPMDIWSVEKTELFNMICRRKTRDYQECYFLPFIKLMHDRLLEIAEGF